MRAILVVTLLLLTVPAMAGPGWFDPAFGTDGVVSREEPAQIALLSDSRIIVAQDAVRVPITIPPFGTTTTAVAVSRLNPDGSTDATFNGGQTLIAPPACAGCRYYLSRVFLQPDGKVLIAARYYNGSMATATAIVARLEADGAPDTTFGQSGVATLDASGVSALAMQADGRILVGAYDDIPINTHHGITVDVPQWKMRRLTASGVVETFTETRPAHPSLILTVEELPGGEILAAGSHDGRMIVRRYSSAGAFISSQTVEPTVGPGDVVRDSAGRFWVMGNTATYAGNQYGLMRLTPSLARDPTFAPGLLPFDNRTGNILLLPGGGALLAGERFTRISPDGEIDTTFANEGDLTQQRIFTRRALLQPDGKFLFAGSSTATGGGIGRIDPARTAFVALESMRFATQSLGTLSDPQVVLVNNVTAAPMTITVGHTGEYESLNQCTAEVAPGASCQVLVHFRPAPDLSVYPNGTLTITRQDGHSASIVLYGARDPFPITHYYRSILRRDAEPEGRLYWSNQHAELRAAIQQQSNAAQALATPEVWYAMAMSFFGGAEYAAFGRDTDSYLSDLYRTFFDREPDGPGLAYWKDQMAQGMTRDGVMLSFMFSPEFVSFTATNYGADDVRSEILTVLDLYRGLLHRLPDRGGFDYWVDRFQAAQCQGAASLYAEVETLSKAFADSPEYNALARDNAGFVADMYNAFLGRGPDLGGFLYWKGQLDSGARARDGVRQAFISSPEFSARAQGMVAQPCLS